MKFNSQIDDKCEAFLQETTSGDAFALDQKSKLVIFGGHLSSTIINLSDPKTVVKTIPLQTPIKWFVSNYEWDQSDNDQFLQTRDKIIEIVNYKSAEVITTLNSHARAINQAKWSPLKRNLIASSSADCNIFLWDINKSNKPEIKISSVGEIDCLAWSKAQENKLAASCNNDIRIYDIRKTSSALSYFSNAHARKIYSLDWCCVTGEEYLLSTSKDRYIKLWNLNMLNEKLMEKLIDEFPCWKAKFTPYGLCFGVLPTCQSFFSNNSFGHLKPNTLQHLYNNNKFDTTLLTFQITGLNEAKTNKIFSSQFDMIIDFDFFVQDDKYSIATWSRDQHIRIHSLDMHQFSVKELEKSSIRISKEEDDMPTSIVSKIQPGTLQLQPTNTTNSSRKSSISEYPYSTPPNNFSSFLSNRTLVNERESLNLNDEQNLLNDLIRPTNKQTSSLFTPHDFLWKYPKTFGAKFSGLPEQFILFSNEGINLSSTKSKENESSHTIKRPRSHTSTNKLIKGAKLQSTSSKHGQFSKPKAKGKVYIFNISNLISIRRDLAEKYLITSGVLDLEKLCQQNILIAAQNKRYNIVKIWELFKFITFNNSNLNNFNPDYDRPWSCSIFGRPLINSLIENCIKSNDIQTAAMIISKLKQHDMKIESSLNKKKKKDADSDDLTNPVNSSINSSIDDSLFDESNNISEIKELDENSEHYKNIGLLDPLRSKEFDFFLKTYCDVLYNWGLYNKRIEMLEFLSQKPKNIDSKFECFKRCIKCSKATNGPKCRTCNSYTIKCSLCELPVNGITLYCVCCGHGGHYDHLIDWFKKHDDCPSACGCRCVDYL